jgi:hypothetical protein
MIDSMTPAAFREAIRQKARDYQNAERELCDMLAAVDQAQLWRAWGYSSLAHYAEDELELTHRKALELIRVAGRLKSLPELDRAFREKGVPFSKIREATRVATPGTDAEWARTVQERPYREIERAVFTQYREETITLRVDMTPEEYERLERAVEAVRRGRGRAVSLASCLDAIAASFLVAKSGKDGSSRFPGGEATSPFTQVIYRCDDCSRAEVQTRRGRAVVSPGGLAQAECDALIVRDGQRARCVVPRAVARAAWARSRGSCERCSQRGWLHLHHRTPVAEGGKHSLENLRLLCSTCHGAVHRDHAAHRACEERRGGDALRPKETVFAGASPGRQAGGDSPPTSPGNMTLGEPAAPWGRAPVESVSSSLPDRDPRASVVGHTRAGMRAQNRETPERRASGRTDACPYPRGYDACATRNSDAHGKPGRMSTQTGRTDERLAMARGAIRSDFDRLSAAGFRVRGHPSGRTPQSHERGHFGTNGDSSCSSAGPPGLNPPWEVDIVPVIECRPNLSVGRS